MTLEVEFEADEQQQSVETYTVTLTSSFIDDGSVQIDDGAAGPTATKTVAAGTQVTIKAFATSDNHFDRWSDNNSENPRTITVNSNINLTAEFGIGD